MGVAVLDAVAAVTGWDTTRVRSVDWAAVEARLGTGLPGDYKQLVEIFGGVGAFDGCLQLQVPDAHCDSLDIVRHTEWLGRGGGDGTVELWTVSGRRKPGAVRGRARARKAGRGSGPEWLVPVAYRYHADTPRSPGSARNV
ncbi:MULTISPECIES: hypothetical protein [Streptomyces]|uniref:SMI1/KNR4 family protein n=1 Tax=Streptomyces fimbriatus TaxID=68197 RepID=A0ABW0DB42_STRFI